MPLGRCGLERNKLGTLLTWAPVGGDKSCRIRTPAQRLGGARIRFLVLRLRKRSMHIPV